MPIRDGSDTDSDSERNHMGGIAIDEALANLITTIALICFSAFMILAKRPRKE